MFRLNILYPTKDESFLLRAESGKASKTTKIGNENCCFFRILRLCCGKTWQVLDISMRTFRRGMIVDL